MAWTTRLVPSPSASRRLPNSALRSQDLCQTQTLIQSPACAYAFWSGCSRTYQQAVPHHGYELLEKWLSEKATDRVAVYTSNGSLSPRRIAGSYLSPCCCVSLAVDGLFRRFRTLSHNLTEIHGCALEWMCGSSLGFARPGGFKGSSQKGGSDESGERAGGGLVSRGGAFDDHNAAVIASRATSRAEAKNECVSLRVAPPLAEVCALERVSCERLLPSHETGRTSQAPNAASDVAAAVIEGGAAVAGMEACENGAAGGPSRPLGADGKPTSTGGVEWSRLPPRCSRFGGYGRCTATQPRALPAVHTSPLCFCAAGLL